MKPVHRDGGSSRVVKPIQRPDAEHEDVAKIEDDEENDNREYAHQDGDAEVALTVVGCLKGIGGHSSSTIKNSVWLHLQVWRKVAKEICAHNLFQYGLTIIHCYLGDTLLHLSISISPSRQIPHN